MADSAHETLYQEHWRRFFVLPQQAGPIEAAIAEALFWNDQMAWSLGVIPWRAWRCPFQKAMLQYLQTHCPQDAEHAYDVVNTALATAHGDYFSLPVTRDRENLIDTVHSFCSEKAAEHIVRQIHSIRPNPPFLGITILERLLQSISQKRKVARSAQYIAYLSYFLHFRVLNEFFKQAALSFTDAKIKDIVALSAFDILLSVPLEAPHFFTEKRLKADPSNSLQKYLTSGVGSTLIEMRNTRSCECRW